MITHETLILAAPGLPDDASLDALLSEIAELEARCAHTYFVERYVKGRDRKPSARLRRAGKTCPRRAARDHCHAGAILSPASKAVPLAGSRHRMTATDDKTG